MTGRDHSERRPTSAAFRSRAAIAAVVVGALALTACSSSSGTPKSTNASGSSGTTGSASVSAAASGGTTGSTLLDQLKKSGTVRIAIANEPPYTEVNADGSTGGIMVDTVGAVMKILGVPNLSVTVTTYASMIPGIEAHQFDIVSGGLFLTAARCQQVIFSDPIIVTRSAFAVKQGNPKGIDSYAWFKTHTDAKLALITPSSEQDFALNTVKIPQGETIAVPDLQTGIDALNSGRADAVASDELANNGAPNKSAFTSVLTTDGYVQGAGDVFRTEDKSFRDAFDVAYQTLIKSGQYATIAKKYNIDPTAAPDTTRTKISPTCG